MSIRYISQKLAQQIDEELMSSSGAFSLDQLMELAGLACAQALAKTFPAKTHKRVMVCCGPGNQVSRVLVIPIFMVFLGKGLLTHPTELDNLAHLGRQGGDGLVAARHLHMFRYKPTIYLPKPGSKDIYQRLLKQCENLQIPVLKDAGEFERTLKENDVVLDAIFGFSFAPPVRAPFDKVLTLIRDSALPILSVDIPSGWLVEDGPQPLYTEPDEQGNKADVPTLTPEALISLTVPKMGVRGYEGRHWLGGRFVPDDLAKKFELNLPEYEGVDHVVELPPPPKKDGGKL